MSALSVSLALQAVGISLFRPTTGKEKSTLESVLRSVLSIALSFVLRWEFNSSKQIGTSLRIGLALFSLAPSPHLRPQRREKPHSEAGCTGFCSIPRVEPSPRISSASCSVLDSVSNEATSSACWAHWDPDWGRQSPATCSTWSTVQLPCLSPGQPGHSQTSRLSWPGSPEAGSRTLRLPVLMVQT